MLCHINLFFLRQQLANSAVVEMKTSVTVQSGQNLSSANFTLVFQSKAAKMSHTSKLESVNVEPSAPVVEDDGVQCVHNIDDKCIVLHGIPGSGDNKHSSLYFSIVCREVSCN